MNNIFETTVRLLGDTIDEKNLTQQLEEGLGRLGVNADNASGRDIEKVLKSSIYHQLQLSLPASVAKQKIQFVIAQIAQLAPATTSTQIQSEEMERQGHALTRLEERLKHFNLYFEWSEVQKFRNQIQVLRQQHTAGNAAAQLVRDAESQLEILERKLEDSLVRQGRDLGDVKNDLERVRSVGGPKLKRLETLVGQLVDAHTNKTLVPAEMERALKLAADLRKLMESSVSRRTPTIVPTSVSPAQSTPKPPTLDALMIEETQKPGTSEFLLEIETAENDTMFELNFEDLSPEQAERVLEIDLKEELRRIEDIENRYRNVLTISADLGVALAELKQHNTSRELVGGELDRIQMLLEERQAQVLSEQRAKLNALQPALERFDSAGLSTNEARMALTIAEGMVSSGAISDDIGTLEDMLRSLERQFAERERERSQESEQTARQLALQAATVAEMQAVLQSLKSVLGDQTSGLSGLVAELNAATTNGQNRDDLRGKTSEEAERLQRLYQRHLQENNALQEERHNQQQRDLASLRGLQTQLAGLPELPEFATQLAETRATLAATLQHVEANTHSSDNLQNTQSAVQNLRQAYLGHYNNRLVQLEQHAQEQRSTDLSELFAQARSELGSAQIPNLVPLEAKIREQREAKLNEQRRELSELEQGIRDYHSLPLASAVIKEIELGRAAHQQGRLVDLASAWTGLNALRAAEEAALARWRGRIDSLIREANTYQEFISETSADLRGQVEMLGHERHLSNISPETRARLEQSLKQAETTLATVRDEYSAAQSVAQAFKGADLNDLLGVFGNEAAAPPNAQPAPPKATPPTQAAPVVASTLGTELNAWLGGIAKDEGVNQVLVLGANGLEYGASHNTERLLKLLSQDEKNQQEFSKELQRDAAQFKVIETPTGAVLVIGLRGQKSTHNIVIVTEDMSAYSRVYAQTHRDYEQLQRWV